MIGSSGIAGVTVAVLLGSAGCDAREHAGERRDSIEQVHQATGSRSSLDPDVQAEDAIAGDDLAEIDVLLVEIEADLRQTAEDITTDEGDVQ